jgi:hypothetical protein
MGAGTDGPVAEGAERDVDRALARAPGSLLENGGRRERLLPWASPALIFFRSVMFIEVS